jgi:LemA protein
VLVFWALGAYNRLLALRGGVAAAWGKVDEARRQRAEATVPLLAALRAPLAAEQGALDALQSALQESARLASAMAARPLQPERASAWVLGEAALAAAASRVFALVEHSQEAHGLEPVRAGAAAWQEAAGRLTFARQLFNETADGYDAALSQFPTRLLLPLFRFSRAGRL